MTNVDQATRNTRRGGGRNSPVNKQMIQDSLDNISSKKIYLETNIYSDDFKMQLMEFCHYYQIPFLEGNIPKSTKNAAKIYYSLLQDGKRVAERFSRSNVVTYLASIP